MSGMVTMRVRKLRTCRLGMSRWSVGRWPTSAGIKTSFHGGLSSPRSNAFWFVSGTHGAKCFQWNWKKVVGTAEWAVCLLVPFSDSCSLSGTGTGDGTLLQISVSQSVDHCDVSSGAAPRVPWQQCQTVRPLAVVTDQPVWFLHAGNARRKQFCRRLTRLSSVVVCRLL